MADLGVPPNGVYVQQFAQAAEGQAASQFSSSASYYNELRKVKEDLKKISSLDMKISPDQPSPVVKFMQMGLNSLYKNKAAGEDGIASEAFVARLNLFIKEHARELQPVASAKEIDGKVLAEMIRRHESDVFGHKDGILGQNRHDVNKALYEALLSIDNEGIKGRGARFNPYSNKPAPTSQVVPETEGRLAYNAQANTLIMG